MLINLLFIFKLQFLPSKKLIEMRNNLRHHKSLKISHRSTMIYALPFGNHCFKTQPTTSTHDDFELDITNFNSNFKFA